ncbi:MAG TPA: hypothetical protein VFD58_31915 [Blastocatellia bacterium]|nr:hypothetical protein [Blastocatellia bacterium]
MSGSKRTSIKNLPRPVKDLTPTEEKQVRGGFGLPQQPPGGQTGATRLSIKTTYQHEGGHTAEDSEADADQNE